MNKVRFNPVPNGFRSSTVRFICDPLADSPNVVVYGEIEPRKYVRSFFNLDHNTNNRFYI